MDLSAGPCAESVFDSASQCGFTHPNSAEQLTDALAAAEYKLESALITKLDEVSSDFRKGDAAA